MCEILYAYRENKKTLPMDLIADAFAGMADRNPDGFGVIIDREHYYKTMDPQDMVKYLKSQKKAREVLIHARIGTSGSKDLTHAHPLEQPNLLLVHNGVISSLSTKTTSDSLELAKMLDGKNEKEIAKTLTKLTGWASYSLFLYDRRTKTLRYTLKDAKFSAAYLPNMGLYIGATKLEKCLMSIAPSKRYINGYVFKIARRIGFFEPKEGIIYEVERGRFNAKLKFEPKKAVINQTYAISEGGLYTSGETTEDWEGPINRFGVDG